MTATTSLSAPTFHIYPLYQQTEETINSSSKVKVASPSFLQSNLAFCVESPSFLAYAHKNCVQVVELDTTTIQNIITTHNEDNTSCEGPICHSNLHPVKNNRTVPYQLLDQNAVSCVHLFHTKYDNKTILAFGKKNTIVLFDVVAWNLIGAQALPVVDDSTYITSISHYVLAGQREAFIVMGTSRGDIMQLRITPTGTSSVGDAKLSVERLFSNQIHSAISSVMGAEDSKGQPIVAIGDSRGFVAVYATLNSTGWVKQGEIASFGSSYGQHADPIIGINFIKGLDLLAVAYGSGKVRLFSSKTFLLRAEISCHARWITSLTSVATPGVEHSALLATVSEDCFLCVHQIQVDAGSDDAPRISLLSAEQMQDNMCTGVVAMKAPNGVAFAVDFYEKDYVVFASVGC